MDLQLDFGAQLPQHLVPGYNKVVSLLTQTVLEWPKGAAMLTRENKGIYAIRIWDKSKAEKLLGKSITYYYEGEKSKKNVIVTIQEKPKFHKYLNPKYVTLVGFHRFPLDQIKNEQIDKLLENFGQIIIPTEDVYADVFLTGKKKVRIDLNLGKNIPRDLFYEFSNDAGKKFSVTLRCYYKDQPYLCKTCKDRHIGDCPELEQEKIENEKAKKLKETKTKTVMIGDSNFRCINERGVMASVTAITGGKIGHVVNQIKFENLSAIQNVVLSSGQNCIHDIEEVEKGLWEKRTQTEILALESQASNLMSQGKNVFILSVPPTPVATSTKQRKEARNFINTNLTEAVQRLVKEMETGMAAFIEENEGNYNPTTDFTDERHLAPIAIERIISKLDEVFPDNQKLKDTSLKQRTTCLPYRGCYGTFPVGCSFCTGLKHNEGSCRVKQGTDKRNRSSDSQDMATGSNKK